MTTTANNTKMQESYKLGENKKQSSQPKTLHSNIQTRKYKTTAK
jgi:hypothetical protein